MTESPMFDQVGADFSGLFEDTKRWDVLVADPEEPFVDVPPPSFEELMEELIKKLPAEVVEATRASVEAELYLKGAPDDDTADQPVPDAGRTDVAGAAVVAGDDEGDPPAQDRSVDAGTTGGRGSEAGADGPVGLRPAAPGVPGPALDQAAVGG